MRRARAGRRDRRVSLRYGVLCRFTAFVAVDTRKVAEGEPEHRVIQPVEPPSGWELPQNPPMMPFMAQAAVMAAPSFRAMSVPDPGLRPRPGPRPRGRRPGDGRRSERSER